MPEFNFNLPCSAVFLLTQSGVLLPKNINLRLLGLCLGIQALDGSQRQQFLSA